jgi:ankyrin repeat protein
MPFDATLAALLHGDFSRLEPQFDDGSIAAWIDEGRFDAHPDALAEALSCASFLGKLDVVRKLLARGVDPAAGNRTGVDALHWAADRGQLEAVRLLLRSGANTETRNMYGSTVLGMTIWSAFHEPRRDHLAVIDELLNAGASADAVEYPTGDARIDALLERHRCR